ncbi:MAG TPA: STAS domain-containing protein [Solirubrobacteraceae bacterium]|nr:STAS domain-containing protein [Solirubrobacteraceae bacterium]
MTSPTPVAAAAGKLHELGIHSHAADERSCVVVLTGEIDLASAPELKATLNDLCGHGYMQFVLDLSGVSHMDSTGLGVLVGFQNRLEGDGRLSLAAVPPNLARLIRMLGLDARIPSFPTVAAALADAGAAQPSSPVALEVPHAGAESSPAEPHPPGARGQAIPIDADAGLVLGLVSTALPFAESELAQAERWLRVLRRYGDAGRLLRESGVREAPVNAVAEEAGSPEGATATRSKNAVTAVTERAHALAAERKLSSVGTLEVLKAVAAAYGPDFDCALAAYGGDRQTLDAYLQAL